MPAAMRVLVVDDDDETRETLGGFFERDGCSATLAPSGQSALDAVERLPFDVVVADVRMPGMDGMDLLDHLKRTNPSLPVILLTAHSAVRQAVDAVKRGAYQYLTKPCDLHELHTAVAGAVNDQGRPVERAAKAHVAERDVALTGESPAIAALRRSIESVAASSAPVLILGETGSGKEVVARAIHARSSRAGKAFVAVNTSAIPAELLEAEIFGHARGAFTGAAHARKGLITEADGGTLLLDEIGDMPLALQAKLLRVLQFREVRPLGSDVVHRVDTRFIAATHQDLPALIRAGRFRKDLYYRLDVLPVHIPPLRARREDVKPLAMQFVAEASQRTPDAPARVLDDAALERLVDAPWPGNVRELQSTIERWVVFGGDVGAFLPSSGARDECVMWRPIERDPWTLKRLSDAYTEWVLARNDGDKKRAAEVLGVNLSTLYRWHRARQV